MPDGRVAVYNTWSEALLVVPAGIGDLLRSGDCRGVSAAWSARLLRHGVLVSTAVDEPARATARMQEHLDGRILQVIAVPTWACNLRCPYCYEGTNIRAACHPASAWATRIGTFIRSALATGRERALAFALFGGEPLLQARACAAVLDDVTNSAARAGVPLQCTLTTNGTLTGPDVKRVLQQVDPVQITIDGAPASHDRRRVGVNRPPTFQRIVDFAVAVRAAGARCVIRYHLHEGFAADIDEAARTLLGALGADDGVAVYFAAVGCGSYIDAFGGCDATQSAHVDVALLASARQAFLDAGWRPESVRLWEKGTSSILPCAIRCGYLNRRTFLIDPALDVFFCPVAVRNPLLRAGRLDQHGRLQREPAFERLLTADRLGGGCRDCSYLPLCEGGCPARAAVRHGSIERVACERERIAGIIDHNMRQIGAAV
jgi:uncharacterized protein